jgi:hypothetical protein
VEDWRIKRIEVILWLCDEKQIRFLMDELFCDEDQILVRIESFWGDIKIKQW